MTIIHVSTARIRENHKRPAGAPLQPVIITVDGGNRSRRGNNVKIRDLEGRIVAEIRYDPDNPCRTGANCWIETDCFVEVV